jgi:hypothetical protein
MGNVLKRYQEARGVWRRNGKKVMHMKQRDLLVDGETVRSQSVHSSEEAE